MLRKRRSHSFGSALVGGAVVAIAALVVVATGLVHTGGGSTTTPSAVAAAGDSQPAASVSHEESNTINQIYKDDGDGVAFIESREAEGVASGSGIVLDSEGHVLTNNHVVEGASSISVKLEAEGEAYPATLVGAEPNSDLALLRVEAPADKLHPLTLGNSSEVEVGDPVVAIGNPFDLERTVTSGIVSALQREIQAPNGNTIANVIQTDAAINPGNSGGPLINSSGEVIGINSQIETGGEGSEGNVGIGFAIPIDTAKEEIAQLEAGGSASAQGAEGQATEAGGFLGVSGLTITPELAQEFNLPVSSGVLIEEAVEGGPAAEAGLQGATSAVEVEGGEVGIGGDVVTAIDGQQVGGMEELAQIVGAMQPGEEVQLTVVRGEQSGSVTVTLGQR
ncbi:MAG TPA: trypsin-like peptidase domain-containing protein [Solirubrobacterales bacterium]|nr:trypsin-like peptidase domain-containing protein [Solirubrobacterales bacterium]